MIFGDAGQMRDKARLKAYPQNCYKPNDEVGHQATESHRVVCNNDINSSAPNNRSAEILARLKAEIDETQNQNSRAKCWQKCSIWLLSLTFFVARLGAGKQIKVLQSRGLDQCLAAGGHCHPLLNRQDHRQSMLAIPAGNRDEQAAI